MKALLLLVMLPSLAAAATSPRQLFNHIDQETKKPLAQDLRVVVPERLYRGPRPANDEDIAYLKGLGVRTIINLQGTAQLSTEPGESEADRETEERGAMRAGILYLARPTATLTRLTGAQKQEILDVVEEMNDPKLQPVFVHCHGGVDRTGIAVAAYRIVHQGCPFASAYAELLEQGKFYTPVITAEQVSFLRELADGGSGRLAEGACPIHRPLPEEPHD